MNILKKSIVLSGNPGSATDYRRNSFLRQASALNAFTPMTMIIFVGGGVLQPGSNRGMGRYRGDQGNYDIKNSVFSFS